MGKRAGRGPSRETVSRGEVKKKKVLSHGGLVGPNKQSLPPLWWPLSQSTPFLHVVFSWQVLTISRPACVNRSFVFRGAYFLTAFHARETTKRRKREREKEKEVKEIRNSDSNERETEKTHTQCTIRSGNIPCVEDLRNVDFSFQEMYFATFVKYISSLHVIN